MTEKVRAALPRWHFPLVVALIGIVMLGSVFAASARADYLLARSRFLETINYIKEQCSGYDNLNLASETKSLMRVIENVQQLRRDIQRDAETGENFVLDETALQRYLRQHTVTGVLLLDTGGRVLCRAESGEPENDRPLAEDLDRDALLDTAAYPEKVYSCRIPQADGSYIDLAACGRPDEPGVLVVYYHTSEEYVRNYNLSYRNIVQSYNPEIDGTVVVAQGEQIAASNDAALVGASIDEVPTLAAIRDRARNGEMVHVHNGLSGPPCSFGMIERGRNFYVYVFRREADVFAATPRNMLFAVFSYAVVLMLVQTLRWKTAQRYREQQLCREQEYQKQLRAEAQKAEAANMAKTEFLQRMSHDIRTPINGIRGMVEIADHFPEDARKQAECRKKIWDASTLLLELVNEVLDMGKLESGEVVLEAVPFDLKELLGEIRTVLEKPAAERGIRMENRPMQVEHQRLIGSPLHVKRLLMNILSNAVKYNKENGSITLECTEQRVEGNTAWMQFVCADTGIGMSEEFQKRLYEPFTQENSGARSTYGGTGLGMAITKSLVDCMGGTIAFESEQGVGTTYVITLPFAIDHAAAPVQPGAAEPADLSVLRGARVLLAEDNALNMEIAEFLLQEAGVEVTKAFNGQQAVQAFNCSAPGTFDAILMDVMMPVMDGHAAARAIRALDRTDAKTVPIFAMTANAFAEDRQKALEAGMTDHLTKPLDSAVVLQALAKVCAGRQTC